MQTIGHSSPRLGSAPAPSLLEKVSWTEKLPLTILCGVLLGFSSAGYGVWWLAWIGLAPLLLLVYGSRTRSEAMLTGLIFGLAYHLVALRWFLDLLPLDAFAVSGIAGVVIAGQSWILESLHQAVIFAVFAIFVYTLPMRAGIIPYYERPYFPVLLSIPLIWVFLEWVVAPSPFFLGVPFDQLAYSQARMPALIQVAQIGGAQLIDFLLVLANCAIVGVIVELSGLARKPESRADVMSDRLGAWFDVILVAALIYGIWIWGRTQVRADATMPQYWQAPDVSGLGNAELKHALADAKAAYAPAIPIAIAQVRPWDKKPNAKQVADSYLPLIDNLSASMIVMPASGLDERIAGIQSFRAALASMAKLQRKDILTGVKLSKAGGISEGITLFGADKFNTDTTYEKYRLLPLVENMPIEFLGALVPNAFKRDLLAQPYLTATNLTTIKTLFGRAGASIGAELLYPDLILSEVSRGASILINVSDLSAFHKSILAQELLAAASLRAVENGRYVVMASQGGISAVIDPHGVVTSASIPNRPGILLDRVQFLNRKTAYSRMYRWTPLYH